jgi:hypothetical protein
MTNLAKRRQMENSMTPYEKNSFKFFVLLFVSIRKNICLYFFYLYFKLTGILIASKKEIAECPLDLISVLFCSISFFGESPTS